MPLCTPGYSPSQSMRAPPAERVELKGRATPGGEALEATVAAEVYDDFPNMVLITLEIRNAGSAPLPVDRVNDAGTEKPFRVSPPEAVVCLNQIKRFGESRVMC
ncbi:MAG TPA: hypothetical protein VE398_02635 [Acidobacteriota bacterium]|nr:hypothetical protein [Acidobacteriota bacterium]